MLVNVENARVRSYRPKQLKIKRSRVVFRHNSGSIQNKFVLCSWVESSRHILGLTTPTFLKVFFDVKCNRTLNFGVNIVPWLSWSGICTGPDNAIVVKVPIVQSFDGAKQVKLRTVISAIC